MGERATAEVWIARARALLNADAVRELHGRLLIVALARLDNEARMQLEGDGFLASVEREITEPLAVLFAAAPGSPEETVLTHTDNPARIDELNREGFARILARRIRDTRVREEATAAATKDEESPLGRSFLVHVHGPWGIGKTSLLNFLRKELRSADPNPWVVVTFNAWQHQRLAPPWWWLMMALYQQGFRELRHISSWKALRFRCREWLWRVKGGWQGIVMLLVGAALLVVIWRGGFFSSLTSGKTFSAATVKGVVVGIAAILSPILVIWGVARTASRWLLTTSARGARMYIEHAQDPMGTMKNHFRQLVGWLRPYSLTIMIDDLDRCKPAYAVELLEGVQTLFRDVPVVYVVAADREWLAGSYASEYSSFGGAFDEPGRPLGYVFHEKTFQMTLAIPVMSEETRDRYWRQLISPTDVEDHDALDVARKDAGKVFAQLQTEDAVRQELAQNPGVSPAEQRARLEAAAIQLASPKLERASEHVLHPFRPLLDANPRAMKRLVNAYGLARGIELLSRQNLGGDKNAQHRTALWTILSLRWPRLAEYLAAHPEATSGIGSSQPELKDVPDDFTALFRDPDVKAVVLGQADGVTAILDSASVRLCVAA